MTEPADQDRGKPEARPAGRRRRGVRPEARERQATVATRRARPTSVTGSSGSGAASTAAFRQRGPARERRTGPSGWRIVATKELADALNAARFFIVAFILALAAVATVYNAAGIIRELAPAASGAREVFLALFTVTREDMPVFAFYYLVGFLAPILGIAFGFDAVNSERSQGTLPRLLSQPIHRDDVINGKFVAGLTVIGLIFIALTALVAGVGIFRLGIAPTAEGALRIVAWLAVTIVYVGFWLAFATLCSVAFRRAATSALVAFGVWLALTLFGALFVRLIAGYISPSGEGATLADRLRSAQIEETISRLSPATLYNEATIVLLNPSVRSVSAFLPEQLDQADLARLLPLEQSLLLIWGQIVLIVALTVISFAAAYILFLRQEVRA